jgi:hypothetical protein
VETRAWVLLVKAVASPEARSDPGFAVKILFTVHLVEEELV